MKLYDLLVKARELWDQGHSDFICNCIQEAECELVFLGDSHTQILCKDNPAQPLYDFISQSIDKAFSVEEFLFGKRSYNCDDDQLREVHDFREQLWQKLFDFVTEMDHEHIHPEH